VHFLITAMIVLLRCIRVRADVRTERPAKRMPGSELKAQILLWCTSRQLTRRHPLPSIREPHHAAIARHGHGKRAKLLNAARAFFDRNVGVLPHNPLNQFALIRLQSAWFQTASACDVGVRVSEGRLFGIRHNARGSLNRDAPSSARLIQRTPLIKCNHAKANAWPPGKSMLRVSDCVCLAPLPTDSHNL